jgi:uncharacterized protein YkwD
LISFIQHTIITIIATTNSNKTTTTKTIIARSFINMKQNSIYLILQASALILLPMAAEAFNRQQLLCLVNAPRIKAGLKPLLEDSILNSTADQVCTTQARLQSKTPPPTDEALLKEVNLNGYQKWVTIGQAVTSGAHNEADCVKKWMADEKTRTRLMDPKYTRWGGTVIYNNGVAYWTAVVGDDGIPIISEVPECPVGENIVVEGEPGTNSNTTPAPKPVSPDLVSGNPPADKEKPNLPTKVESGGANSDTVKAVPPKAATPVEAGETSPAATATSAVELIVSVLPVSPKQARPTGMENGVAPVKGNKTAAEPAVSALPVVSTPTMKPKDSAAAQASPVPPPETQPGYKSAPAMASKLPASAYGSDANPSANNDSAVASASGDSMLANQQVATSIPSGVSEVILTPPTNTTSPAGNSTLPANIDDDTMYSAGITTPPTNTTSSAPAANNQKALPTGEHIDINGPTLNADTKDKRKGVKSPQCKGLYGSERKECRQRTREAVKEAKESKDNNNQKETYSVHDTTAY